MSYKCIDLHIHTVACGHAFSTIKEIIDEANKKGMTAIGISEHGPAVKNIVKPGFFMNLRSIPKVIDGIRIYKGAELNLINKKGDVDLSESILKRLDYTIVSLHRPFFNDAENVKNYTQSIVNAISNDNIDILGHIDRVSESIDSDTIIDTLGKQKKIVELNNKSLCMISNYMFMKDFLTKAKKNNIMITLSSDAHIYCDVGFFDSSIKLIKEVDYPENLIVTKDNETLEKYISERRMRLGN